jgi:hypothetical protein
MRTSWIAALAALGLSGCSLMIDADSVAPPEEKKPLLGACIDATGGHALCGGHASGGALPSTSATAHAVKRGTVNAAAADLSGTTHRIKQGTVSP